MAMIQPKGKYKFNTLAECEETLRSLRKDFKVVKHEAAKELIKKEMQQVQDTYSKMLAELKSINLNDFNRPTLAVPSMKNYMTSTSMVDWHVQRELNPMYSFDSPYPYLLTGPKLKAKATVEFNFELPSHSSNTKHFETMQDTFAYILSSIK